MTTDADRVGCTEPKANCTIKRRIGAVRPRLIASCVLDIAYVCRPIAVFLHSIREKPKKKGAIKA
ncbi:hypothetical protein, partial [Alcanivorax sp. HI0003]|uniref:hypothetical protein n=1 Tax=Alcanivorax sp. HI0003 TaxID=1822217 RepID=UPI001E56EABE